MSDENDPRSKKDYLLFIAAILVFILYLWYSDAIDILKDPPDFKLRYILLAFLINFLLQIAISYRFGFMLQKIGNQFSWLENLFRHLILPLLARITPGQLGMAYKVTLSDIKRDDGLFVHFLERMGDFILLLTTASLSILYIDRQYWSFLLTVVVIFLVICILILIYGDTILNKIPLPINIRRDWIGSYYRKYGVSYIFKFALLAILNWTITIILYYSLGLSINLEISIFTMAIAVATTYTLAGLTALPGGLGAREFSMTFFLTQIGVNEQLAVTFTLLYFGFVVFNEMVYFIMGHFGLYIQKITITHTSPDYHQS